MEQFENVKQYAANTEFDIWIEGNLEYISPYFELNLPKSVIQTDVFFGIM